MNCFEDSDDIVLGLLVLSAIRANDTVWFERLMELPRIMAAINASSNPHMLHECARRNRVAFAEFFLKQGVDVDDEDENGDTPYLVALTAGHTEMMAFLLKHGATEVALPTAPHAPRQVHPLVLRHPALTSRFNENTRALASPTH